MPMKMSARENPTVSTMDEGSRAQINGKPEASLIDGIPDSLVFWLASPYIAGRTMNDAMRLAHKLYKEKSFTSTLDILGEDCTVVEDCQRAVQHYTALIDTVIASPIPAKDSLDKVTISFKPSMFSHLEPNGSKEANIALEEAYDRIKTVVDYAYRNKVRMTLEAEDSRWTDFQLETYFSLLNCGYTNLGTVLQTRLYRTQKDLARFDDTTRVRLVIGIYNEAKEIALTDKPAMKELLVKYGRTLLENGSYVEMATHDTTYMHKFFSEAVIPTKATTTQFETQFLLGVPRRKLQDTLISGKYFDSFSKQTSSQADTESQTQVRELMENGIRVRMYLPFGEPSVAGAYCKRRLKGNPNMISYGIKNLLHLE